LSPSLLEFTRARDAEAVKAISEQELDAWLANLPDISAVGDQGSDIQTYEEALSDSNFVAVNSSELKRLQEKNTSKNTMKTTTTWLNRFGKWQSARRIPQKLEDIPEQELDTVLQQFFA